MKRILVTGATGCVGRFVLPKLVDRGWDVWAVRSRSDALEIPGVHWRRADLLDPADVRRVVDDSEPSHLLHLAWYIAPGKWAEAAENFSWVRASLGLLSTFKQSGGRRAVFAGSCLEYDWNYGFCSEDRTPLNPHTTRPCPTCALIRAVASSTNDAIVQSPVQPQMPNAKLRRISSPRSVCTTSG